jgi:hypothetical protein
VTKRVYLERLKVLINENEKDIFYIITHPQPIIKWIKAKYTSEQTQKSYISAVLAVFRHNEGLKQQENKAYTEWYEAFQNIHNMIEERYKKNEPTQKQKEAYVPYSQIVKARDSLAKGTPERLLFAFYTYLPPLRCDFNRVRIYTAEEIPKEPEANYIHLKNTTHAQLVLNEYKTQGKRKSPYVKDLPEHLIEELEASLKDKPRDWLFTDKNMNPYVPKSFTKWANRVFARVLKKKMTVSMIRHSFINSLDFNTISVAEKEAIANDMAHTVGTQDRYRLIFKE